MTARTSRANPAPKPFQPPARPAFDTGQRQGCRALVVDGDAAMRERLGAHLTSLGRVAGVDFAADGTEALEKARSGHYGLVFLDAVAGLDGYETCSKLRKMPEYKKTPIILLSASLSLAEGMKGVIAGCTLYLAKPVRHEAVMALGRRVLA